MCWAACHLCTRQYARRSFVTGDDLMDFELDEIAPLVHPLSQESGIVRLHDLVTASELGIDPACYVREAIWSKPATLAKSLVDRLGIAVAKALNHHVLEATHSDAHAYDLRNALTRSFAPPKGWPLTCGRA